MSTLGSNKMMGFDWWNTTRIGWSSVRKCSTTTDEAMKNQADLHQSSGVFPNKHVELAMDHSPSDNKHTVHSNNGKNCSAAWKHCKSIPVQIFQTPETIVFSWDKTDKTISFSRKKGCKKNSNAVGMGFQSKRRNHARWCPPSYVCCFLIPWKL